MLDAWGFEQKTILTWVKDRIRMGHWLRGQTEHCIMAVRGKPIRELTNQSTVLYGPVGAHSQKPEAFYNLVERLCRLHDMPICSLATPDRIGTCTVTR